MTKFEISIAASERRRILDISGWFVKLHIEPEMDNVAIFHEVVLAFQAPFAGIFGAVFAVIFDEIVVTNYFGTDKAFFKVSVDDTGRVRGGGAGFYGPGADFFDASGEESL